MFFLRILMIGLLGIFGFYFLNTEKANRFSSETSSTTLNPNASLSNHPLPLILPIEKIFETLHGHHVEEAYQNYTSSGFKNETSFQTFNQFIEAFPVFTDAKLINYHSPIIEEGIGNVTVELKNEKQEAVTLDILLVNEDNTWKILGLQVLPNEPTSEFKEIKADDAKNLALIINRNLKTLAQGDLERSYKEETSEDFKQATSFVKFKELIAENPVLTNHKDIQYSKLHFNNNVATYGVYLTDVKDNKHYMEYDFIKDGDTWKILQIVITGP